MPVSLVCGIFMLPGKLNRSEKTVADVRNP